jgi:adenosylcobinamide-GDP ribazoletransferase
MSELPHVSTKWLIERAADLLVCLRFCTRVPIPKLGFETPNEDASLAACASMLPVAGALIGAAAAIVLCFFAKLGLPASLTALIAVAALILITGALHEDGLADCADGLGGTTQEQRLAIMKDSRIGTYGGLALVIFVLARVLSLAFLAEHNLGLASAVLIAAGASSRSFALLPLYWLAAARPDGLGAATAGAKHEDLVIAGVATLIISLLPLLAGAGLAQVFCALTLSAVFTYGVAALARRLIQGHTGDVAGATQQIAELVPYLVFTAQL